MVNRYLRKTKGESFFKERHRQTLNDVVDVAKGKFDVKVFEMV